MILNKKRKLVDLIIEKFSLIEKEAVGLILSGMVFINDKKITKTGLLIDVNSNIRIKKTKKYVSRGAFKLIHAIREFNIELKDKVCLDVGSSTGGFTDVLLRNGVKRVYSVDCGTNLLHYKLRINPKVTSMENTKITDLYKEDFKENIDLAVMDVSFSSAIHIIQHLHINIGVNAIICLVKPQFEYKRLMKKINLSGDFNGIVLKESERQKIINFVKKEIEESGLKVYHLVQSGIKGTKGNIEYLLFIKNNENE